MRATLEFDLDDTYDAELHLAASRVRDYFITLFNLDNWLREQMKYQDLPADVYDTYDLVRKQMYHFMDYNGVSLDDLT